MGRWCNVFLTLALLVFLSTGGISVAQTMSNQPSGITNQKETSLALDVQTITGHWLVTETVNENSKGLFNWIVPSIFEDEVKNNYSHSVWEIGSAGNSVIVNIEHRNLTFENTIYLDGKLSANLVLNNKTDEEEASSNIKLQLKFNKDKFTGRLVYPSYVMDVVGYLNTHLSISRSKNFKIIQELRSETATNIRLQDRLDVLSATVQHLKNYNSQIDGLKQVNGELTELNRNLTLVNQELKQTNEEMKKVNEGLEVDKYRLKEMNNKLNDRNDQSTEMNKKINDRNGRLKKIIKGLYKQNNEARARIKELLHQASLANKRLVQLSDTIAETKQVSDLPHWLSIKPVRLFITVLEDTNIRAKPDAKSPVLYQVNAGDVLRAAGYTRDHGWYEVEKSGVSNGYIFSESVETKIE